MKRFRSLCVAIVAAACGVAAPVFAADSATARTITVSGEAEVRVAPDEVLVTLGTESRHNDLTEVKRLNDRRVKDIMSAITAAGVPQKDVRTDYLQLQPEHEYSSGKRTFVGYVQRNTMVVTLKDISKFDALISAALQAGADHIHGIDFRTSELRKHRDVARALAVKAAKEKARALATELGEKVGRVKTIQEGQGGYSSSYGGWWGRGSGFQNVSQNVMQNNIAEQPVSEEGPIAPGSLSVRANVTVTFTLE